MLEDLRGFLDIFSSLGFSLAAATFSRVSEADTWGFPYEGCFNRIDASRFDPQNGLIFKSSANDQKLANG